MAFWVGYAAAELTPVYERLKAHLKPLSKIAVDETTAPVLDPGRGRTKTGYFWAIARDDRPWGGPEPPAVAYTYAPGRGAVHASSCSRAIRGIVQCDGYAAYKTLVAPARAKLPKLDITLAFCWTHWRRYFTDIERGGPAPIAAEAIRRIGQIYATGEDDPRQQRRGAAPFRQSAQADRRGAQSVARGRVRQSVREQHRSPTRSVMA